MVRFCQTSIKLSCSSWCRHSSTDTLHNSFLLCSSDFIDCSIPSPKLWKTMKECKKKICIFSLGYRVHPSILSSPIGFLTLRTISKYSAYKPPGFQFKFTSGRGTKTVKLFSSSNTFIPKEADLSVLGKKKGENTQTWKKETDESKKKSSPHLFLASKPVYGTVPSAFP